MTILQNSGVIGSGATVRIRGVSSFSLSNQPLIYVDGIRVDNAQGTGPLNQSFGASTTTRWNDFNPDDIESIEIVKGPAAATLYGSDASAGVIQVLTKKGRTGVVLHAAGQTWHRRDSPPRGGEPGLGQGLRRDAEPATCVGHGRAVEARRVGAE